MGIAHMMRRNDKKTEIFQPVLMIVYDRLWNILKQKNIFQYKLIHQSPFSRGQLSRIKNNDNINTSTLNRLCEILDCNIEDIMEYLKAKE